MSLKYGNTFASGLMLGINRTGPAGILPAGASGSLTFLATPAPGASSVNFSLSTTGSQLMGTTCGTVGGGVLPTCSVTPGALFADAASLCQAYQPPNVSYLGFTRTCMQLLANLGYVYVQGPTVLGVPQSISQLGFSALVNMLSADATALSKQGTYEYDMGRLISFELNKDGLREFNQRYHQGAFGFGPSHAFDITASGGSGNGYPVVFYPDGTPRPFKTPSPTQSNQYLGTVGDYGVLTVNADGTWQVTESNGVVYHFKIDPVASSNNRHLVDYIQDVNGNRTTVGYTNDLVTSVVDPLGNTLSFAYDSLGHITQSTDPEGRVTTYTYDIGTSTATATPPAFLTSVTNSSGTTSFAWNEGGPTEVGYFNNSCAQTYCEPAIGVSSITYPDGTHKYFTYDAVGRVASQSQDGQSATLTYTFGSSGTITVTDAVGNVNSLATNEFGKLGQYSDPLGSVTQLSYDPESKLTAVLAQMVTVTDSLDPNLDWSTVQLNAIEFNNASINMPGGLQSYAGQVSVSTDPNPVNINAALNPSTGVLTWSMQSVDPITDGTPENPLAGFLPPNNASNQGTGYVTFTVYPKANLNNGAVINNQASIVFDNNAPIATNSVMNTIDNTNPTSYVNTLPATTTSSSFPVSWTGTDPSGSGIAGYTIVVSIDGGAYSVWMASTPLTSATYTGVAGHSYSFYSLATDNVGNVQIAPGTAQTTTVLSLVTYTVTPSAGTGGTISPNTPQTVNANGTASFTVTPSSGYRIASVTGCGGTLSGNTYTTAPVTAVCTVSAAFSAITYTVTPNAGAGGTISPNTPQTVNANSTTSLTVTPSSGYQIASVMGCGGTLLGSSYTTTPVTAACTVAASFSQTTRAASATSITSSTPNPSAPGVAVLISFKVTGGSNLPTGTVSVAASTGESCAGVLTAGVGNCSITFASVGTRSLKASYPGDANFAGSVSSGVTQVVNAAIASVSPSSINFGSVYLGLASVKTVTLTNSGNTPLSIGKVQVTGGNDAKDFVALSLCRGTLAAGKSCQIGVTFVADGVNYNPTGTLSITDNAPGSPQVVSLSATVINPKASLSKNSLSFGKQKVGTASTAQSVKLTNVGTTPLTVSGLSVSGQFAIASATTCANGTTLAANAGCVVTVNFIPTAKGVMTGALTIKDNALLPVQTVTLSGTGN